MLKISQSALYKHNVYIYLQYRIDKTRYQEDIWKMLSPIEQESTMVKIKTKNNT